MCLLGLVLQAVWGSSQGPALCPVVILALEGKVLVNTRASPGSSPFPGRIKVLSLMRAHPVGGKQDLWSDGQDQNSSQGLMDINLNLSCLI